MSGKEPQRYILFEILLPFEDDLQYEQVAIELADYVHETYPDVGDLYFMGRLVDEEWFESGDEDRDKF